MLKTLNTLLMGQAARADESLKDHFALDLIDQKVREADAGLRSA